MDIRFILWLHNPEFPLLALGAGFGLYWYLFYSFRAQKQMMSGYLGCWFRDIHTQYIRQEARVIELVIRLWSQTVWGQRFIVPLTNFMISCIIRKGESGINLFNKIWRLINLAQCPATSKCSVNISPIFTNWNHRIFVAHRGNWEMNGWWFYQVKTNWTRDCTEWA